MTASEVTIVGYPFLPIGMGEHTRSTVRAFQAAGVAPRLVDVAPHGVPPDPDLERDFRPLTADGLGTGVNLFCVNGDEAGRVIEKLGRGAFKRSYNIIYPAWELARYPAEWAKVVGEFDEVWAPSEFIREAIAGAVAKPVTTIPLAVDLKLSAFLGRRHYGIPEDAFVVLFFFDFSSFAERKNPTAVLEAFEQVARRRPEARLHCVIKSRGGQDFDSVRADFEARVVALGPRAQAIYGDFSDNAIKNLIRVCDVFVSLHRSEGFGRGMAEAMAMGRPAIATGYSGNVDYMAPGTSLLVDYQLIPVAPGAYPRGEGQVWADASPAHAAELIEQLLDDPAEARAMGARGRAHIAAHFSTRAVGARYVARLREIGKL